MSGFIDKLGEKIVGAGKPAAGAPSASGTGSGPGKKEKTFAPQASAAPAAQTSVQTQAAAVQAAADNAVKVEDDRSIPLAFAGDVVTAPGGALAVPDEARNFCALFDNGLWLVSASHRRSPLVTSVAQSAKRQGIKVDEPRYVTPNIIVQAYLYAERRDAGANYDDNAVRRRIVATIEQAVQMGANDIHIEAVNGRATVQFRIDGALRPQFAWTQREGEQFLAAVYSHSIGQSGATANWSEPQAAMLTSDARGREIIALPKGVISVRCQWVPLANDGRYLDMRLQYDSAHLFGENFVMADVDSLGFSQEQLRVVQSLRAAPGGLRIFSGPVNQGKTTTLRVTLNRRMAETEMRLNCLLIEDPPEGGIIGARQIGVSASVKDEQREKTFVEIMRCALRLDPDIVMLGEIRDLQTAKFAFRLALTGRQVYTTGHVYSALATPKRLRDIGIEPYIVYDHHLVRGMACQRLLRSLCPHCRIPIRTACEEMGPVMRELAQRVRAGIALLQARRNRANVGKPVMECLNEPDMSNVFIANPEGCEHCYKGRSGRTVAAEIIETDIKLMELLQDNRMEEAENYWLSPAGLNGITMLQRGIEKVAAGEVSPDDAEFELGVFAREREVREVEEKLGPWR
ncbi:MAG: Flp pilus assembly complex ATPase component TadA [Alphaproteobacteria bacterium]|nr:Flp pilus assembly complex ATPase component TadA [Alphaproteobacteria bacterium]